MEGLARRVCIKMSTKAIKWRRSGEAFSTCDISQHLQTGSQTGVLDVRNLQ